MRGYAPTHQLDFPHYAAPDVVAVGEAIPSAALTGGSQASEARVTRHEALDGRHVVGALLPHTFMLWSPLVPPPASCGAWSPWIGWGGSPRWQYSSPHRGTWRGLPIRRSSGSIPPTSTIVRTDLGLQADEVRRQLSRLLI